MSDAIIEYLAKHKRAKARDRRFNKHKRIGRTVDRGPRVIMPARNERERIEQRIDDLIAEVYGKK